MSSCRSYEVLKRSSFWPTLYNSVVRNLSSLHHVTDKGMERLGHIVCYQYLLSHILPHLFLPSTFTAIQCFLVHAIRSVYQELCSGVWNRPGLVIPSKSNALIWSTKQVRGCSVHVVISTTFASPCGQDDVVKSGMKSNTNCATDVANHYFIFQLFCPNVSHASRSAARSRPRGI